MKISIITNKYAQAVAFLAILVSVASFAVVPSSAFASTTTRTNTTTVNRPVTVTVTKTNTTTVSKNNNNVTTISKNNKSYNYYVNTGVPAVVTPVVAYNPYPSYSNSYSNYSTYPIYGSDNYYNNYPNYYASTPLTGSCYAQNTSVSAGQSVTWSGSAAGGNGVYTYSWNGTDGFSGYGQSISMTYYTSGTKVANLTITSNGQSISIPCSSSIIVFGNNYNNGGYNYNYNNNYYTTSLQVACSANTSSVPVGAAVLWNSAVTGGNGSYSYSWSGTDGLYGSNSSISTSYGNTGIKTATLTVYSGGQTISQQCSNTVSVGTNGQYGNQYNYNYQNNSNGDLSIACAVGSTNVAVGSPVTWSVEVSGGNQPYSYAWTGTDGFSGSQSSVVTEYSTRGTKSATVTVTSADGRSSTQACSNTVYVGSQYNGGGNVNNGSNNGQTVASSTSNSTLSGASLFSISNIPWGWVAVLVILVLMGMVIYLIFNRNDGAPRA